MQVVFWASAPHDFNKPSERDVKSLLPHAQCERFKVHLGHFQDKSKSFVGSTSGQTVTLHQHLVGFLGTGQGFSFLPRREGSGFLGAGLSSKACG